METFLIVTGILYLFSIVVLFILADRVKVLIYRNEENIEQNNKIIQLLTEIKNKEQ